MKLRLLTSAQIICVTSFAVEQIAAQVNYNESRVPAYTLPDPLMGNDGQPVKTAEDWRAKRRGEILKLFQKEVYGISPTELPEMTSEVVESSESTPIGKDIRRKQVTIRLSRNGKTVDLHLLVYLPKSTKPVPAFLGLNFKGNHTVANDPAVPIARKWEKPTGKSEAKFVDAQEPRGSNHSRWPIEDITSRGYALATIFYGDIDPDFDDGFKNGVHALYDDQERNSASWGSISAWAWGLSRALDYLETDDDIDASRVAVMGHSRLGKTALWAGAQDERFALVVSNNSGCGGAALSRRAYGETVKRINTSFPHWFCDEFSKYNDREGKCPVDQHELIALIAPRPILVCSAEDDLWADPRGEFLSAKNADAVYRLLGTDGMAADNMPGLNEPILSRVGYHIRPGMHNVKPEDWQVYLNFADRHLRE